MGLNPNMTRFLSERLDCNSDKEAAERIGVRPQSVSQWKIDFPEFRDMYEQLSSDGVKIATEMLRQKLGKAAEVVIETLKANNGRKPDYTNRLAAAKLLMQSQGMLKERRVHEGDPDNPIEVRVTADDLHEGVKRAKGGNGD